MNVIRTPIVLAAPVYTAELADRIRVDELDAYSELIRLGRAAAAEIEAFASLALLKQTVTVALERWPKNALRINLPIGPYVSGYDAAVTVDGAELAGAYVTPGFRPVLIVPDPPGCGQVVITYDAGFGETPASIPDDLRIAVADQACTLFDQRGTTEAGLSAHAARIAARYRRVGV